MDVVYITFTSKSRGGKITIDGKVYEIVELKKNVDPKISKPTYVVKAVHLSKRAWLGANRPDYRLSNSDRKTVNKIFKESPAIVDKDPNHIKKSKRVSRKKR